MPLSFIMHSDQVTRFLLQMREPTVLSPTFCSQWCGAWEQLLMGSPESSLMSSSETCVRWKDHRLPTQSKDHRLPTQSMESFMGMLTI